MLSIQRILSILVLSLFTQASFAELLLTRKTSSGFVVAQALREETCSISSDKVVIDKTYGYGENEGIHVISERPLQISPGVISVIGRIAKAPILKSPQMACDGPSSEVDAYHGDKTLVIYHSGGCSEPQRKREGFFAQMLMDLVEDLCH